MSVYVPCMQKLLKGTQKNIPTNLEIHLISKIFERNLAEVFYYCFIEASFGVHLYFCRDTEDMHFHFSAIVQLKCCTIYWIHLSL